MTVGKIKVCERKELQFSSLSIDKKIESKENGQPTPQLNICVDNKAKE